MKYLTLALLSFSTFTFAMDVTPIAEVDINLLGKTSEEKSQDLQTVSEVMLGGGLLVNDTIKVVAKVGIEGDVSKDNSIYAGACDNDGCENNLRTLGEIEVGYVGKNFTTSYVKQVGDYDGHGLKVGKNFDRFSLFAKVMTGTVPDTNKKESKFGIGVSGTFKL
jgi:hypothetical protein